MNKNLINCPICDNKLNITKYQCISCGTEISGNFELNKFATLNQEQLDFIEVFVLCRGSIKEIEKELGISYPTVRNKLDNVISALGHKITSNDSQSKLDILNMLDNGELTTEEATLLLKELN